MNRRTLIRRIGAASAVAAGAAGGAAGTHFNDGCHSASEDPDCRFLNSTCAEITCPIKCCNCLCAE